VVSPAPSIADVNQQDEVSRRMLEFTTLAAWRPEHGRVSSQALVDDTTI
jgi:hypothetical protein